MVASRTQKPINGFLARVAMLASIAFVEPAMAQGDTPNYAPRNPFLTGSVAPIAHVNSAQSTGMQHAGPVGPSEDLSIENGGLTYTHLGPGHYGLAISDPYPNGKRVIWSNGGERISKLDYDTLAVIDEYILEDSGAVAANGGPVSRVQADMEIAMIDALPKEPGTGLATVQATLPLVNRYYGAGTAGVYYLLSADNVLFVGGASSILAYADEDPSDPNSDIILKAEWVKPDGVDGNFVTMNMTYDGWLVSITEAGWIVVTKQDFSESRIMQMEGAEIAPAWNAKMLEIGRAPGSATWVRNGAAIDEDGSIYIPSLQHMHKVVWDGDKLSKAPEDGAWVAPYSNMGEITVTLDGTIDPDTGEAYVLEDVNIGTGSTASLMGFGDEDQFVVITDGDKVMNMVLFWRKDIPEGWEKLEHAPSRRIAGMLRADIGQKDAEDVQTDQSVVVGGYGASVVNNAAASKPSPQLPDSFLVGLGGNHPDFAPNGAQKFEWDPVVQELKEAWVSTEVSSSNCVPLVANGSNMLYTVGAENSDWIMQGLDWTTGEVTFKYNVGSSRYNTAYSGVWLDQEGRLIHTTTYGIVRYERLPE